MFRKNMPFGKEKLSRAEMEEIIEKTESRLGFMGGERVRGGVFSAVASLAAIFVVVAAGAFVINGVMRGGEDINASLPSSTVTSGAAADSSSDVSGTDSDTRPDDGSSEPAPEITEVMIEGVNLKDIDLSVLSDGERFYYGPYVQAYLALDHDKYTMEPVVSENKHLRITIESMLCDNISVNMIATIEALDGVGKEQLKNEIFEVPWVYTYDKNGNKYDGGSAYYAGGEDSPSTENIKCVTFQCANVPLHGSEQEVFLKFHDSSCAEALESGDCIDDVYDGIEIHLNTTPNLDTITLVSASGKSVYISPACFYDNADFAKVSSWLDDNGESVMFISYNAAGEPDEHSVMKFGWYYNNLSNIAKIDYNGETYYLQ